MARVTIDDDALADAGERVASAISALGLLEQHPRIGRPAASGLHELVMGQGVRGQREDGFKNR